MSMQSPTKILIVEDQQDIAELLKLQLEAAGFDTAWAADGESALSMLLTGNSFALVLLDIMLYAVDGIEVLKRLQESHCDAAVIMMSGHGNEALAVECMKSGATDYLTKPYELTDLLQRINRALDHRLAVLEKQQLEQEREDFFLMLSHDMKNPMAAVIGSIDIVREGRLGAVTVEQSDYLQAAIDSSNEIVTMIDNLLDVRRFEAGKMRMTIRPRNPHDIICRVSEQFARTAEQNSIRLNVISDGNVPDVAVDQLVLIRVLANLLGNALKFSLEEDEIVIACRCVEGNEAHATRIPIYVKLPPHFTEKNCFVRLSVSDNGNGIPSHELGRVFDRYTRLADRTEREQSGAGLSLAFCKLAIESFDGAIWAESKQGQGIEFIILLPCFPGGDNVCKKHIPGARQ
ncbi:MAG TPA: response regulator [Desulfuromonadales bacterium]|nr:response regulator [Desulfuromonadales bacterium]